MYYCNCGLWVSVISCCEKNALRKSIFCFLRVFPRVRIIVHEKKKSDSRVRGLRPALSATEPPEWHWEQEKEVRVSLPLSLSRCEGLAGQGQGQGQDGDGGVISWNYGYDRDGRVA